ncbi:reverse transcriptase [Caerostris darwini]|uniref:Reverse transcriptase n=1 Tax=Caerostris darwini TaxID=1538125 RepID=A0AAV4NX76_9ARAC|nr:reverse transcriptase [Caerostris darwini]
MADHYGEEGTYQRFAQIYYWIGMRSYIANYVKKCSECCRFKATNQKPAGFLRTTTYAQRFQTLCIVLFGSLPENKEGHKWILIVEDCPLSDTKKTAKYSFCFKLSKSDTTGHTAAYLQFGCELWTGQDVVHDLKTVLDNDNIVSEFTPYLRRLAMI